MAPQSLSQLRASASSCAEATLATPNDQIDIANNEHSTISLKYLDRTSSLSTPQVLHRPTHASTNRITSPSKGCICSTTMTLALTTTLTTQVPHAETSHTQCENRHIIDGKYTYRCVCLWTYEHTKLEIINSQMTDRICSAYGIMSTAITRAQEDDVVEEGTRAITGAVPNTLNSSLKKNQCVTGGKSPKAFGNDDHQESTVKAPGSLKNLPLDVLTPSSTSIVLPTSSSIAPSISDLLAHSKEPSHSFTALPAPTTSKYPRPSPPTFFYPTPIVPHQEYHHRQYQHSHLHCPKSSAKTFTVYAPTILARMDYTYTYIPLFYKLLLYILIALGFLWAILVYYVNFPSAFPLNLMKRKMKSERRETKRHLQEEEAAGGQVEWTRSWSKKKRGEKGDGMLKVGPWTGWLGTKQTLEKKKPIDKRSKYASVASNSSTSSKNESTGLSTSADTTPLPSYGQMNGRGEEDGGIELKQRRPHTAIPLPVLQSMDSVIGSTTSEQQSRTPSTQARAPLSPANPFLPPILRPRKSSDWLHEHSKFFSSAHLTTTSSHSRSTSSGMSYEDVDAMEAQTPLITTHLGSKKEAGVKKNGSWLDMVDGAVNRAVGRVARWTDGDGEEGLLLPIANE